MGYQAYIRSFADHDGDGMGDLRGIVDKVDYLAWLGVDAVWINPFFPSPGHDHGYDVSDYVDVDPQHGTLADFDELISATRKVGIRVIVDIVPNHTSNEHAWFTAAVADPTGPFRDFYIWKPPAADGGPPNNWVSHFGGPAWTFEPVSGEYYCHLFLPEQPDLNWQNPAVADAFDTALRFWLDRGAAGFRIDVAHGCHKDPLFRDNPQLRTVTPNMSPRAVFDSFDHRFDLDQDTNIEVFRRWNQVVEPYGAVLIGELGAEDAERAARYVADGDALHQLFYLRSTWLEWEPAEWKTSIESLQAIAPGGVSWVLSCHDRPRPATRFGRGVDDQRAISRSLALSTLAMVLGGMPFVYQGEELGLPDGNVDPNSVTDPLAARFSQWAGEGRDGCRTPMPWDSTPNNGFTRGEPWLKSAPRPAELTVESQRDDPESTIHRYRDLLAFRHKTPQLCEGQARVLDLGPSVIAIERPHCLAITNLATEAFSVDLSTLTLPGGPWHQSFSSKNGVLEAKNDSFSEVAAESTSIYLNGAPS